MKKIVSFLLAIFLFVSPSVFAKGVIIDDSFKYATEWECGFVLAETPVPLVYQITKQINSNEVKKTLNNLEENIQIPFDFNIHIMNFQVGRTLILGLAQDDSNVILFDFMPYESKIYTHDTLTHEIGHLIYNRMTDEEKIKYVELRELPFEWTDDGVYHQRPTEIFAEDFRLSFGDIYATALSHLNEDIPRLRKSSYKKFVRSLKCMSE